MMQTQLERSAAIALKIWGLAPDTITPQPDGIVEVHFAANNPQATHARNAFLNLERDGRIALPEDYPFRSVLGEQGNDFTAWIRINPPKPSLSYWQRFKHWLGF